MRNQVFGYFQFLLVSGLSLVALCGCSTTEFKIESGATEGVSDQIVEGLSLVQMETMAVALQVAFNHASSTWKAPGEPPPLGCAVSERQAERGLAVLQPWIERRVLDEAKELESHPKTYRLPTEESTCLDQCLCNLGHRILSASNLNAMSAAPAKIWRAQRSRMASLRELQTTERAELCAEAAKWVCGSSVLAEIKKLSP